MLLRCKECSKITLSEGSEEKEDRMEKEISVRIEKIRVGEFGVLQVFLCGNFLYSQHVNLKGLVLESLEVDTRGVIIDLSELGMIDSSGLGTLAALQTQLAHTKVKLVLAGLNPQTQSLMRTSGMKDLFMQFDTVEEVISYFKGS